MADSPESNAPVETAAVEKAPAKKAPAKEAAAKKAPVKKAVATTAAAKKAPAKKAPAKKAPAKKATANKATAKKATAKKVAVKEAPPQKIPAKTLRGGETITVACRRGCGDFATCRMATDDPVMRSTILGLLVLESSPDWSKLRERYERATRLAPVLRSVIVEGPTGFETPRVVV
ncbi:MAG: histone H1-like repetitive region-containing protein, partial [Actinobacteria bacterium]|nr:histone H1-like repetitive region-containing protein [Actinomycetota bacterium]